MSGDVLAAEPYPMKAHDWRILRAVVATNGGGYSTLDEPRAPVQRLRAAGLIQRKKGQGNMPWVHTPAGLALLRARESSPCPPSTHKT